MRVVIPSVRYADFLAVVLPRWQEFLPQAEIVVVTDTTDTETHAVADRCGVACCATDIWYRQQATSNVHQGPVVFNKAAALDLAFGFVPEWTVQPKVMDVCLALDCDVVPFGTFPADKDLNRHTIYGCPRYACETPEELETHTEPNPRKLIPPKLKGHNYGIPDMSLTPERAGSHCLGYFQLFRYRPNLRFGSYRTAGGYDMDFKGKFTARRSVKDMYVLHLGEQDRANWKGRVVSKWV